MPIRASILLALSMVSLSIAASAQTGYRVGEQVQVKWSGGWYGATILEVRGNTYKVRYAGYDSSWDEYVTPDRIAAKQADAQRTRAAGGSGTAVTGAASAEAPAASLSPEGRYICQSFEGGLLHNQGEFLLRAGGSYQDLMYKSQGGWSYDKPSGGLRFSGGSLANGAEAKLVKNQQGKVAIRFDWGGGNERWCYRQGG